MRTSILLTIVLIFCFSFTFGQNQVSRKVNSNKTQNNQNQTNQSATPTETPKPVEQAPIEPTKTAENSQPAKEQTDETNWNKWSAIGTIISAVVAVIVFIFVAVQSRISYNQLGEMRRQANIVESQASTMQEQLEVMKLQTKAMQDGLEETRTAIKQNLRAIEASEKQVKISEDVAETTKNAFYLNERAYISCEGIGFNQTMGALKTIDIFAHFVNTGKSPADDFITAFGLMIFAGDKKLAESGFPLIRSPHPLSAINLNSGTKKKVVNDFHYILPSDIAQAIGIGTAILVIVCKVFFKDMQQNERTDNFTFTYTADRMY